MRRLLLLRHAKAERSIPGTSDRDRSLIDRGRKDACRIGAYMASHALVPDRVLLSPVARTQETWKFAAKAFKPAPGAGMVEKLYGATQHCILAVIKDIAAPCRLPSSRHQTVTRIEAVQRSAQRGRRVSPETRPRAASRCVRGVGPSEPSC